jgi:Na+-driven multidrug efflux pump
MDLIKGITTIGFSSFVMGSANSFMMLVLNNVLAIYGGDLSIAIFGIASKLTSMILMPITGISHGFQPIVGYNYGAKNYSRVNESIKSSVEVSTAIGCLGFLIFSIFPDTFFRLFSTDTNLINGGVSAFRIMILATPLIGLSVVGTTLFQAIGRAKPSLFLSMCRQILFLIPMVIILPHYFGLTGAWMAFPLADLMAGALSLFLVVKEYRYFQQQIDSTPV